MRSGNQQPDLPLVRIARAHVDRWLPGTWPASVPAALAGWNEDFCRRVALWYDQDPGASYDAELRQLYDRFKWETLLQLRAMVDAGYTVAPWLGAGQPYSGSAELCAAVRNTHRVYVYLTRAGHGDGPALGFHPLREPCGVVAGGVELAYNDVFRAVHDVFGHAMYGNSFSVQGEFRAAYSHMQMYTERVHQVLFTEQVAQICWYFFGPHLETGAPRRYPDQKVLACPQPFLAEFKAMFAEVGPAAAGSSTNG
jgi:hypothetical protein